MDELEQRVSALEAQIQELQNKPSGLTAEEVKQLIDQWAGKLANSLHQRQENMIIDGSTR